MMAQGDFCVRYFFFKCNSHEILNTMKYYNNYVGVGEI